jgi:stage II sporulation protein R
MKKVIMIFLIPILILTMNTNKKDDLIRIRVIANSNSEYDQSIKMNISNKLKNKLYDLLKNEEDVNKARDIIKNNISNLENIVKENLNTNYNYTINYGMNYFPKKEYNGKIYKEGEYESLLVTLGEGLGDNWWCILFPPICLMEAEEKETNEEEYSFFIKDLFDTFFNKK